MESLTRPRGAWLAVLRVCQADAHRLDQEFGGILKDALLSIPSLQVSHARASFTRLNGATSQPWIERHTEECGLAIDIAIYAVCRLH